MADNWLSRYRQQVRDADQQACLRAALRHNFETEAEARAFHKGWCAKAEYTVDRSSPANDRGGNSRVMGAMFLMLGGMLVLALAMFTWQGIPMRDHAIFLLPLGIAGLVIGTLLWRRAARLDGERWREFNEKWGKQK